MTWDGESQQRFLQRIAAESARLGRLVDDLLDFSAIESGILRLQRDWCDISAGARRGRRLPAAGRRGGDRGDLRSVAAGRLGRPRPAGAGVREPAGQRHRPQPARHPGERLRRGGRAGTGSRSAWPTTAPGLPAGDGQRAVRADATPPDAAAPAPGSGCPSPGESLRRTAGGSCWTSPGRGPASGSACPSRCRTGQWPASRAPGRRRQARARRRPAGPGDGELAPGNGELAPGNGSRGRPRQLGGGPGPAVSEPAVTTRALVVEDDPEHRRPDPVQSGRPGLRHGRVGRRPARAAAAGDRGARHRAARPDAARGRRLRAVPADPRALVGGDHRGLGPRRRAGQGHRAERGRRRLHDQAVQHRGTAGQDHGHAPPDPARPRPRRPRRRRSPSASW